MRTACIYHANCWDGLAAAWAVKNALVGSHIQFVPMQYGEILNFNDKISGDVESVIVVDFSFPKQEMINIARYRHLLVLDHHKTAQADCEGLDFCRFDMNESGASMAWKYFYLDSPMPLLIKYIKDRDLWLFKEYYSREINAYIQSFPMTFESLDNLDHEFMTHGWDLAYQGGKSIERYKNTMIDIACHSAVRGGITPFRNLPVMTLNATMLISEIGHKLCELHPDCSFAAMYFDRKDGKRQWSLRSIGDFDVSIIAKQFGGGGHKNAAGFEQDNY